MKLLPRYSGLFAIGKLETGVAPEEDMQPWWLDLWRHRASWWGKSPWLLL